MPPPSPIRLVSNLSATQLATLTSILAQPATPAPFDQADLIVIEARGGHDELNDTQVAAIEDRVRRGACLLVTLSPDRQLTSMRLAAVLPSITWQASGRYSNAPPSGSIALGTADPDLFPAHTLAGKSLPFFASVDPLTPEERGQSRYARYARKLPVLARSVEPGDQFWTRSLLLRDVRIRLRGDNNAATPLLATGRFGAGRTALFASGFDPLAATPALLAPLLTWLQPAAIPSAPPIPTAPELTVEYGPRSILLHLRSATSLAVEVVGRAFTWENAPLGFDHDLLKQLTLPAGQTISVQMPFPPPSSTTFQALTFRDAFHVRVAILGNNGADLLLERQLLADFTPPITLAVQADDLDHWPYPFHAPGSTFTRAFTDRMGARIGAYAYPPGATLTGSITVANGLRDLTPLATVTDDTTPGNPSVASLLDGSCVGRKTPIDSIVAFSHWTGKPAAANTLTFTFPHPVTLASVTLVGNYQPSADTNPDSVSLQIDGKRITSASNLAPRFLQASGNLRLDLPPTPATQVTLTLAAPTQRKRSAPSLTEVRFEGWHGTAPAPVTSELTVTLEDAHTPTAQPLLRQTITLQPGESRTIPVTCVLPTQASAPAFHRLQATFHGLTESQPILVLTPPHPLPPLADIRPPDAPDLGFIVTRGFRNCFPIGTGTAETGSSWATPDDLIWAYSRQMKEVGPAARTQAGRLYVTEGDMRHYAQPWRTFANGAPLFDEATPNLIDLMSARPHYKESAVVHFGNSDRWETGPQIATLHGWQDFVAFDEHLRASGRPPLQGRTREEIATEIHHHREDEWQSWQFAQYLHNLRTLRDGFAAHGKRLLITAQGCPVIAGPAGAEVAQTVQAMSDDCSWGMAEASVSLTTGRQLAEIAHNPVWKMSTLLQYGYVSSILSNPEWHAPPGTLEPTRRQYYDRAWRATIWPDGSFASVYSAGYGENAGISFQMSPNDWIQWWQLEERHSLLSPEQPIGAGLVISTIRFADPDHLRFNADDIFASSPDALGLARTFQHLHEAGLSLPFSANATALEHWTGSAPLIILNPNVFVPTELATLENLQARGVRMVAISSEPDLTPRAAALFRQPGTLIHQDPLTMNSAMARAIVPDLNRLLAGPATLPPGTAGYGFTMSGTHFLVVEDHRNEGRIATVRLRATVEAKKASACEVNTHHPLLLRREGPDWLVEIPLRPGDAQLIALRET